MSNKHLMLNEVERCMRGVKAAHEELTQKSWEAKAATVPDYKPLPKRNVFYDETNRTEFNGRVLALRKEAEKAVSDYLSGLTARTVKTPSEDELRAVQMFKLMDPQHMTKSEYRGRVEDMMNKFGDSAITYEALRSIAQTNGIQDFPKHPDIQAKEAAEDLQRNVSAFFTKHTVNSMEDGKPVDDAEVAWNMFCLNEECGSAES